jgi:ribosomal protein S18 acetylase RimI-like enzyme
MKPNLVFKLVSNSFEAESLRKIRNECREFMTRNTEYISEEDQQKWFLTAHKKYQLYLLYNIECGVIVDPIGYGLIRTEDTEYLVTGGLTASARGKGIGQKLFKFLIDNTKKDKPLRLEVLKTNVSAFNVYKKLGFITTYDNDKLVYMEYKYDSPI